MKTNLKKGLFLAATFLILSSSSFAQAYLNDPKYGADEESRRECAVNLSLYREHYNQKNYKMAKPSWLKVLNICPAASQNAYIHGVRMMKTWIDEERNPIRKAELTDSLMMVYDMRMEHFNRHGILMGQKGMDLFSIDTERYEEAYEMLKKSIEEEKDGSDSPVIYTYMVVTKTMFDNGKLPAEAVIETYALLADYLDEQIKARPDDDRLISVKENVDALFSSAGVADCNNLTEIFESRIDNNPDDVDLIKKTHSLLSANRCEGTDFYQKTVVKLFDKEPEAMLAYEIAKIFTGSKNYEKAEVYFKHAIELEQDPTRKSVFLVEYAGIIFNEFSNPQKARTLALQALSENPNMGHAYILIGNIYAAEKNCFGDDFQKKTVYWAAVDKFAKAKQVDPTIADDCDRLIDVYKQYFPAQNDIFFQDLQPNQTYTVGCWINETTTVRARP
jgi:tetratricopeptide (TPR) repeat protein